MSRGRLGFLALAALVLAYASLAQGIGWNQNAQYALVRALADGTPIVDPYRDESGDVAWVDGHYYSTKPPGLAFVVLPVYVALEATGALDVMAGLPGVTDEAVGALWALGFVGSVLPAALILLLVRRVGGGLAPAYGVAAAVAAGAGTLLLPFATLFFAHVLSAALGFAAFVLLWGERERERGAARASIAASAGLLAGFAVVAHYSLALIAAVVGVYALVTRPRLRTGVLYCAGATVGVLPLLLYNWWAFGSPTHLSYRDAVLVGGASGHDVLGANAAGFFGIEAPSFATGTDLLLGQIGLVTLTPVVAIAAVGVLELARSRRAEALVVASVTLFFLVYNSGYVDPFGGFSPGPRFLIPILPFLCVGLAPMFRRLPLTTSALALISVTIMVAVTITQPLLAYDGRWIERIENGSFGGHGLAPALPFVLLVAASVTLASMASPRLDVAARDLLVAALACAAWLVLFLTAPAAPDGSLSAAVEVLAGAALLAAPAAALRIVARGEPKSSAQSAPAAP